MIRIRASSNFIRELRYYWLVVVALQFFGTITWASDYVFVVDTSGSMLNRVSATEGSRIQVVQKALRDFFRRLPTESRICLISFNAGIQSEREILIRNESDRNEAYAWITGLESEARKGGATYLCSTLRRALGIAATYSSQHPGETVTLWALTDGGDNEGNMPESETPQRLRKVLDEFPNIDEGSIRADLTILGSLALNITSNKPWFHVRADANFQNVVPPMIEWSPEQPKVGDTISFLENSPSTFLAYDWLVDGQAVSQAKVAKKRDLGAGVHTVKLTATAPNGTKLSAVKQFTVQPADQPPKLTADFVAVPGQPEPGEKVRFVGRTTGNPNRFAWLLNGQPIANATAQDLEVAFPNAGRNEIRFQVGDAKGATAEHVLQLVVQEPSFSLKIWANPSEALSGQKIQFTSASTGTLPDKLAWEFGDGTRSDEAEPVHEYSKPGDYVVKLDATSRFGSHHTAEPYRMKVLARPLKPNADFKVSSDRARVGATIGFVNESSGSIEQVAWKFDDEGSSTKSSPDFSFSKPGEKVVVLTVTGPAGSDSMQKRITVLKLDQSIVIQWIDGKGKTASATPVSIDFGQFPAAHARSGEYPRPDIDSFDVILPTELPVGGGLSVGIGEKSLSAIELVKVSAESGNLSRATGLITQSGRYRLHVRSDAPEGSFADTVTLTAQGTGLKLNNDVVSAQIPLKLEIEGGGYIGPVLLVLGLIVASVWLGRKLFSQTKYPPKLPLEVTLQEMQVGSDGKAIPLPTATHRAFVLALTQRIHLGHAPGLTANDNVFDIGAPQCFLIRHAKGLWLHRNQGGTDGIQESGTVFTVVNEKGDKRKVRPTLRIVPAPKIDKNKPKK